MICEPLTRLRILRISILNERKSKETLYLSNLIWQVCCILKNETQNTFLLMSFVCDLLANCCFTVRNYKLSLVIFMYFPNSNFTLYYDILYPNFYYDIANCIFMTIILTRFYKL